MSASSYDEALSRLLAHEGGYSNHPSDPGGPTINAGLGLRRSDGLEETITSVAAATAAHRCRMQSSPAAAAIKP